MSSAALFLASASSSLIAPCSASCSIRSISFSPASSFASSSFSSSSIRLSYIPLTISFTPSTICMAAPRMACDISFALNLLFFSRVSNRLNSPSNISPIPSTDSSATSRNASNPSLALARASSLALACSSLLAITSSFSAFSASISAWLSSIRFSALIFSVSSCFFTISMASFALSMAYSFVSSVRFFSYSSASINPFAYSSLNASNSFCNPLVAVNARMAYPLPMILIFSLAYSCNNLCFSL